MKTDPAPPLPGAPPSERRKMAILAVDDFPSDLWILSRAVSSIREWEADLVTCQGPAEFLAALESRAFDALLIDYTLGAVNGIELLREARQAGTDCPAIFLTVRDDARSAVHALQAGAADFISKDELTSDGLKRAVEAAIERANLQHAIAEYRKKLERTKESLERRNEEIRSFYRTITQELRAPLGTAIELLDSLSRGATTPEHRETVAAIRQSCDRIAVSLRDVLDVGRLETGKIALWLRADDVGEVVERAAAALAPRAKGLGVELGARVAPDLPAATIDRQRVSQMLANLVDRALEFTPAGGRITIEAGEDPADEGFLVVSVADTGPGIPPDAVQALSTFFRGDEAHGPFGHGLGLCREIARLHRGEITVESEVGRGTTFSFTLPKASAPEAAA